MKKPHQWADWVPKVGDVVEYVGNPGGGYNEAYLKGIGVVVYIRPESDYSPQLDLDWIVMPPSGPTSPVRGGVWAGNCKKITEVENG